MTRSKTGKKRNIFLITCIILMLIVLVCFPFAVAHTKEYLPGSLCMSLLYIFWIASAKEAACGFFQKLETDQELTDEIMHAAELIYLCTVIMLICSIGLIIPFCTYCVPWIIDKTQISQEATKVFFYEIYGFSLVGMIAAGFKILLADTLPIPFIRLPEP